MKDSVRLNASIRSSLSKGVLRHKFQKMGNEIVAERQRIALLAYNIKFDEETRKKFQELPEGWLQENESMPFQAGGRSYSYRFDGWVYWNRVSFNVARACIDINYDHRRMRAPDKYDQPRISDGEFILAVERVEQQLEKLEEAMKEAHGKVHVMLTSYTTIGTLKKAWPEIEPFIPAEHEPQAAEVKLPAVRPATLNAMLDLPV